MAEKSKNVAMWLKFFRDAGITGGFDTKYALVFDENRMRMNMLLDLNKECLRDMGIKAMGDIIAILKHAKIVHDESIEQAFESSKPSQSEPTPPKQSQTVSMSPLPLSSVKPALAPATASSIRKTATATTSGSNISSVSKGPAPSTSSSSQASSSTQVFRVPVVPVKEAKKVTSILKKVNATLGSSTSAIAQPKKRVIVLRGDDEAESDSPRKQLQEEVPFQKKTRVLPEHEGKYKISMPQSPGRFLGPGRSIVDRTTPPKTIVPEKKTGIFKRLGDSNVTSTSTANEPSSTKNSRTSSDDEGSDSSSSKASVFARLGGRADGNNTLPSIVPNSSKLSRTISNTVVNSNEDRGRGRLTPPARIEIGRRNDVSSYKRSNSSASESEPSSKRVYRNPITFIRESSPPPANPVRSELRTSSMRSEIISKGRPSCIKSRLDSSSSSSVVKKISSLTTRPLSSSSSEENGSKSKSKPVIELGNLKSSRNNNELKRVVTKKHNASASDPFELPDLEFDDPTAYFYD